ncbi:hypothetical protein AFLA70_32g004091 [Aspergillus flavus AF70]|nr:hypothetical protein AFLA70_32g004091 [Aspergillus flavus AF70]
MRQMVSFPSWGSWAFLQVYARGFADADKAETENQVADKLEELGPLLYHLTNAFSSKYQKDAAAAAAPNAPSAGGPSRSMNKRAKAHRRNRANRLV